MCRAHFDRNFVPVIDKEMQNQIKQELSEEFEARKQEMIADGLWTGNKTFLRFCFGNTHEDVANPKPSRSDPKMKNSHRWAMFMSLNDNIEETGKYIKRVTYFLHPSFKPNKFVIEHAPFILSRVGWGFFSVQMVVEFQDHMNIPPMPLEHMLDFNGKGKT